MKSDALESSTGHDNTNSSHRNFGESPLNILFLSSGDRVPSSRFRILPYLQHFRSDGHRVAVLHSFPQKYDYFPWIGFRPSQLLKRSVRWWHWLRTKLQRFDVVFIDREIFDNTSIDMERRFRESCGRLVIDLDDAVFLRYPEKFQQLMKMADLVVCGNRYLAEYAELHGKSLVIVPTSIDIEDYEPKDWNQKAAALVVGWIGTSGNLKYLAVAAEALRRLSSETAFELQIVVDDITPLRDIDLSGVQVQHIPWHGSSAPQQIRRFDIGIMPLFENQPWDQYKCGFKLVQYLATGIPGVAAPIGVNADLLDGGRNGLAAQTTDEWFQALQTLARDPEIRKTMGNHGRKMIEKHFTIQGNYPALRDAIRRVVDM